MLNSGFHPEGDQPDYENPSEWFGGRLAIGRDLLKRLNATASQVEKDEMGIKDTETGGVGSSFDYSGTSVDLGPGAGYLDPTQPTGVGVTDEKKKA